MHPLPPPPGSAYRGRGRGGPPLHGGSSSTGRGGGGSGSGSYRGKRHDGRLGRYIDPASIDMWHGSPPPVVAVAQPRPGDPRRATYRNQPAHPYADTRRYERQWDPGCRRPAYDAPVKGPSTAPRPATYARDWSRSRSRSPARLPRDDRPPFNLRSASGGGGEPRPQAGEAGARPDAQRTGPLRLSAPAMPPVLTSSPSAPAPPASGPSRLPPARPGQTSVSGPGPAPPPAAAASTAVAREASPWDTRAAAKGRKTTWKDTASDAVVVGELGPGGERAYTPQERTAGPGPEGTTRLVQMVDLRETPPASSPLGEPVRLPDEPERELGEPPASPAGPRSLVERLGPPGGRAVSDAGIDAPHRGGATASLLSRLEPIRNGAETPVRPESSRQGRTSPPPRPAAAAPTAELRPPPSAASISASQPPTAVRSEPPPAATRPDTAAVAALPVPSRAQSIVKLEPGVPQTAAPSASASAAASVVANGSALPAARVKVEEEDEIEDPALALRAQEFAAALADPYRLTGHLHYSWPPSCIGANNKPNRDKEIVALKTDLNNAWRKVTKCISRGDGVYFDWRLDLASGLHKRTWPTNLPTTAARQKWLNAEAESVRTADPRTVRKILRREMDNTGVTIRWSRDDAAGASAAAFVPDTEVALDSSLNPPGSTTAWAEPCRSGSAMAIPAVAGAPASDIAPATADTTATSAGGASDAPQGSIPGIHPKRQAMLAPSAQIDPLPSAGPSKSPAPVPARSASASTSAAAAAAAAAEEAALKDGEPVQAPARRVFKPKKKAKMTSSAGGGQGTASATSANLVPVASQKGKAADTDKAGKMGKSADKGKTPAKAKEASKPHGAAGSTTGRVSKKRKRRGDDFARDSTYVPPSDFPDESSEEESSNDDDDDDDDDELPLAPAKRVKKLKNRVPDTPVIADAATSPEHRPRPRRRESSSSSSEALPLRGQPATASRTATRQSSHSSLTSLSTTLAKAKVPNVPATKAAAVPHPPERQGSTASASELMATQASATLLSPTEYAEATARISELLLEVDAFEEISKGLQPSQRQLMQAQIARHSKELAQLSVSVVKTRRAMAEQANAG